MSQSLLHQVTYSDEANVASLRKLRACLNPFYIRSRIPTWFVLLLQRSTGNLVSIPFTSGHVFRLLDTNPEATIYEMSQSLLHQVTYSDPLSPIIKAKPKKKSQSLLHQVTYSDRISFADFKISNKKVSIPFTSGHVFRQQKRRLRTSSTTRVSIPFTSGHVFRLP